MRNSPLRPLILLVAALTLCVACQRPSAYYHYESVAIDGWDRADTLQFHTAPAPSDGRYDRSVGLRIGAHYPFTAVTLIVEQTVFPSQRSRRDTLTCQLTDENGHLTGDGVSHFQYLFPLPAEQLTTGDSVVVHIHHAMRREQLPGISSVGFKMLKHSK